MKEYKMEEKIKKYTFKSPAPVQIEVVPIHTLTTNSRQHLIIPHRTSFYHIFLFKNCQPVHWIDFNPIHVNPYSLLFIDKERVHQFDELLNYEGDIIIFTDSFFCQSENDAHFLNNSLLFNDLYDNCVLNLEKASFEKFYTISKEIDKELKNYDKDYSAKILKNLLHNFLLFAEKEKQQNGFAVVKKNNDYELFILFRDLVEKNYKNKKSVAFYAKQLACSERRLGQATKNVLDKLPKDIINERVILEAKRLLVHEKYSIKEISYSLHFEEPTNFIKYFKKNVIQTPLEFREANLKNR